MFIKLTDIYIDDWIYVKAESIECLYRNEKDCYTVIRTQNRTYEVKETPEEIIDKVDLEEALRKL